MVQNIEISASHERFMLTVDGEWLSTYYEGAFS